jgi:hypothetical protein
MTEPRDLELPVVGQDPESDPADHAPSCSPSIYVTNEEASLLAAMRTLKERAAAVRERMLASASDEERTILEDELEELRARRADLARRRDQAYRSKMVMLGHLPPDALLD